MNAMRQRIGRLSEKFFASGQIVPHEVGELAELGFRSIVNNRPDAEEPGQPDSAAIEAAAARHGLAYRYLPVFPPAVTARDVDEFRRACADLEGPILLFCRSGARSTLLWQLAGAD
jgi:uncharacterized protein (TIGR01244 family)